MLAHRADHLHMQHACSCERIMQLMMIKAQVCTCSKHEHGHSACHQANQLLAISDIIINLTAAASVTSSASCWWQLLTCTRPSRCTRLPAPRCHPAAGQGGTLRTGISGSCMLASHNKGLKPWSGVQCRATGMPCWSCGTALLHASRPVHQSLCWHHPWLGAAHHHHCVLTSSTGLTVCL